MGSRVSLLLGVTLAGVVACAPLSSPPRATGPSPDAVRYQAMLDSYRTGRVPADSRRQIEAEVAQRLRDPASRQFRNIRNPFGGLVCGEVNARNGFGGYTGFQPFFAVFGSDGRLTSLRLAEDYGPGSPASRVANETCRA